MAENSTPRKATKHCQCMLGWKGLTDGGSSLEMADDPGHVCDRETRKSFAQGHDARMSGRLATEVAKGWTSADIATKLIQRAGGTAALVSKMLHSAELRMQQAEKKTGKAAERQADTGDDEDEELLAAGAENMANDEGIDLNEARERLGLDALDYDADEATESDEDAFPELPELGTEWSVRHGKRSYKAKVIETPTGERIAMHKLGQGRDCYHDLSTGDIVDLSADADDDGEEIPF